MNCPLRKEETADILLDYSAGRLDAARTAVIERHMANCAECAAFSMGQSTVWNAMDAWTPSPVSLDFNRRLWQRIDAAEAAPWYERIFESLRFAYWKPVLPLSLATVLIAAGFLYDHAGDRASAPTAPATSSVSVTEADQVEQTLDDIQLLHQFNAAVAPGNAKTM